MKPWEKYGDAPTAGPWTKYGSGEPSAAATPAPPGEQSDDSMLGKVRYGVEAVTEPLISAATAIPAQVAGGVAGAAETLTGGKFGTQEGIAAGEKRAGEVADKFTYQPRNPSARNAMEYVQKLIDKSKLQGLNPAAAVEAAPAVRAAGQATRAAAGEGVQAVKAGAGRAVDGVAGAMGKGVAPDVAELARKAQAWGIDIRPDMLTDNKFARLIGEAFEKVPLSGARGEQRQIAFNRVLGGLVGADKDAKRLTPDVFDRAMIKSGEKIGEISGKAPVTLDPVALERHVHESAAYETGDVAKIVKSYVADIQEKGQGGTIDGVAFRKINSKLGRQIRTTNNGDLKAALSDLQDTLQDALEGSRSGAELAELQAARKQYAIGKAIEPLVAKSKRGDVSPAGLMGVMTSDGSKKSLMARGRGGEAGDLARIGQMFLKEPDSSNTTERAVAYGIMSGGGFAEPHTAAGVYAGANAYNRLGPGLARRMLKVRDLPPEARATPIGDLGNE